MNSFYKHDIKFYQIDTGFYELKDLNSREKIDFIINYHREKFESENNLEDEVSEMSIDNVEYIIYVFDEIERESKWKSFLPTEITADHDFNVVSTSFTLFAIIDENIYALIGGKGISVIQRFINQTFGIDFFEKLAEPENDIVHSITVRGVIGKLSSENKTYRNEQSLQDALSIGTIPVKVNLLLRKDLKDTIFDFIDFDDNENVYIEIGSSFNLKWKFTFDETHEFIVKMNEVMSIQGGRPLSRFEKISDSVFCEDTLKQSLYEHIRDDMVRLVSNDLNESNRLDYDFIHPSKLLLFYECDRYEVYLKGGRKPILETRDRIELYYETLRLIHGIIDPEDRNEFRKVISGVQVKGFVGDHQKTKAPFLTHVSCELSILNSPYFLIDTNWYQVRGDFINAINQECSALLRANELLPNPLSIVWNKSEMDEGDYNLEYLELDNFIVLDKMLGQNIELCDLFYETDENIYLIHVKEGFDAKMRDVTNQVSVSAQRLWHDIKSNYEFVESVYIRYSNSSNYRNNLTLDQFKQKFDKKIN